MKRSLPWLEIILTVVLVGMILIGVNAIFGADIQGGIGDFCTANSLWCAPPTPTPTSTPTPTPTPRPTRTPMPTGEFTPTGILTPTGVITPADTSTPIPAP